jgi:DNA-binding protein H-NS
MEKKVLTQEEITQLKNVREKRIQLVESFGILELRTQEINLQKENLKDNFKQLIQEETDLGENLQQKYGDGSIDLEKGEFIPN